MISGCKGFKNESMCELILIAARVDPDFCVKKQLETFLLLLGRIPAQC